MRLIPEILPADPAAPEYIRRRPRNLKYGLLARIVLALELARERRQLARLGPDLLNDIGLSPEEARREADRRPWDVPDNWRHQNTRTRAEYQRMLAKPDIF